MKLLQICQLVYYFIRSAINPNNIDVLCGAGEVLCKSGLVDESVAILQKTETGKAFFQRQIKSYQVDLSDLSALPRGSLGRSYLEFLESNAIDPLDFSQLANTKDDPRRLESYVRETHDMIHTLTGVNISVAGELGVQAFMASQINWPFAYLAIGAGNLITLFKNPNQRAAVMKNIALGSTHGKQAKMIFGVDWREYLPLPIEEVRQMFNLPANLNWNS